jgi:hypothetical protein
MDKLPDRSANPGRRTRSTHAIVPLIWIAVLLASWIMIAEWKMLPELVNAAMGAVLN